MPKLTEERLIMGLAVAILLLITFEVGQIRGFDLGKAAILELLSNYRCDKHMILSGGSVECTTWVRRHDADGLPIVRNVKPK